MVLLKYVLYYFIPGKLLINQGIFTILYPLELKFKLKIDGKHYFMT